jgi:hypothetical protein
VSDPGLVTNQYHERRFGWLRARQRDWIRLVFEGDPSIRYQSRWIWKHARRRAGRFV